MLKHCLGSLVKILGVSIFPCLDPFFKASLDILCLKAQSANLMESWDRTNLIFEVCELAEFLFEILELWICCVESLKVCFKLSVP